MRPRLALDQNFPVPIIKALQDSIVEVSLDPIYEIDPRLSRLDDWALLVALKNHPAQYMGLITTDARMLDQPRELAAMLQTGLSMIVAVGAGHDPLRATGLVLTHLPRIAALLKAHTPQIWRLNAHTPKPDTPRELIQALASKQKTSFPELFNSVKLTESELSG
ncbi:MAG: hypothetical protein IPN01_24825 [Deltaproteobacteria bacterium]|nr:hypothetical protein [Deltaproteobacteria bacterium]